MTFTIRLGSIPTYRTPLRSVLGVNLDDLKAFACGLVRDVLVKLVESPLVKVCALRFSQFVTFPDALEFFKCNRWIAGFFRKLNNTFTDDVISVFGKTRLFSALPFQNTPDTTGVLLCLLPLETGSRFLVASADVFRLTTTKEQTTLTISHNRKVVDATVNADNCVVGLANFIYFFFERDRDINVTFFGDIQATITKLPFTDVLAQFWLTLKGYRLDSPRRCPDTKTAFGKAEITPTNATLQGHSGVTEHHRLFGVFLLRFEGFVLRGDVPEYAGSDLRGQAKSLSDFVVNQFLQFRRIKDWPILKGHFAGEVAGIVPGFDSSFSGLPVKANLYFGCALNNHIGSVSHPIGNCK